MGQIYDVVLIDINSKFRGKIVFPPGKLLPHLGSKDAELFFRKTFATITTEL